MDALHTLLDEIREEGVDQGHWLGMVNVLIARKITKAGAVVSNGMTWRDLSGPPSWSSEDLLRILVEKARDLDRIPVRGDFPKATVASPHYRTFADHFGTWNAALREAGLIGRRVTAPPPLPPPLSVKRETGRSQRVPARP